MTIVFVQASIILLVICKQCLSQDAVRSPPKFLQPDKRTVMYKEKNENVLLNCSATGHPTPTYQWTRNGTAFYTDIKTGVHIDAVAGTVRISNFSLIHEGFYRCKATVDFDNGNLGHSQATNLSPTLHLRMVCLDSHRGPGTHIVTRHEYEYMSILCDVNKHSVGPDLRYNWYQTSINALIRPDGGRIFVDKIGTLHFAYLNVSDSFGNRTIACGLSTNLGGQLLIYHGSENILLVSPYDINSVPKNAPGLRYSTKGVVALIDTIAWLECVFSGFDISGGRPRQWWRMASGQNLPTDKRFSLSIGGQRLAIENVSLSDEGTYECVGNNSFGLTTSQVVLDVRSEPIFVNGPSGDITAIHGRDAVFSCDTRSLAGDQPPDPAVWYINGERFGIKHDSTKFHVANDSKHLTVTNVQKLTDIMCVQCEVTNSGGNDFASSCLRIILPITVRSTPPAIQKIRHGDKINLTATATADPDVQLHYKWEFGSGKFDMNNAPSHFVFSSATMEAYINTSMLAKDKLEEVAGHYNIVIYHDYETKVLGTTVIISDTSQEATTPSNDSLWTEDYTYVAIAVLAVMFLLLCILLLALCILRQKKSLGESEEGEGIKRVSSYLVEERIIENISESDAAVESAV